MDSPTKLHKASVARFSRQLIMSEIGVKGQIKLQKSSALIIGAGGLGCPAAQYLAAAGVGTLGIVDFDDVEISNLHRQILHTEQGANEKWSKADSAAKSLQQLNSQINVIPIIQQLDKGNAADIFKDYDLVLDATDNVASRYLISDVCVLTNKPLVSGSALRWEGQLTIYNYTDENGEHGPCYRCLYPKPPPPESVTNCSDGGVIGVVPGIIGCMQALEAIKIIAGLKPSFHKKLYVFDGLTGMTRTIKLRPQQTDCVCCGKNSQITLENLPNYTQFCGAGPHDKCQMLKILNSEDRISVTDLNEIRKGGIEHLLVDVRNPVELQICSLSNSINVPIHCLQALEAMNSRPAKSAHAVIEVDKLREEIEEKFKQTTQNGEANSVGNVPVFVMCRMGNDSQKAVTILKKYFECKVPVTFKDIKGGLMAWANQIDESMAQY